MTATILFCVVFGAWVALIIAACVAEAALGDVPWPRRRARPRRRTSWADDPRSHEPTPEQLESSRRSTLPAPPDEDP